MKAVRSIKNQYLGINAHLHSYWQAEGGWKEFHTSHIVDLARMLKAQLLPIGYTAAIQDSLQIRRADEVIGRPESDVAIYDLDPVRPFMAARADVAVTGQVTLALPEILSEYYEELSEYRALGIYQTQSHRERGEPVAWIELLSPSNKLHSQDLPQYRRKRLGLLRSGVVFIELDYLHESPPTFARIPLYAAWRRKQVPAANAHPYRIVVVDPRPTIPVGKAYHYQFDVDEPLPSVAIPLNDEDVLHFDFNTPYHYTLEANLFGLELMDYSQLPDHFNRYSNADQARIAARMVAVLQAAHTGIDLESGPFPVEPISLEAALAQIETLKQTAHE